MRILHVRVDMRMLTNANPEENVKERATGDPPAASGGREGTKF